MTDPTRQPALSRLIARLASLIGAATDTLQNDPSLVDDWYDEVARQLRRYTLAAYLSGNGQRAPTPQGDALIAAQIKSQLQYLAAFRDEIKAAGEWKLAWNSRAQMYAESIKASYWNARTKGWALPSVPGDGSTICLTRCRCSWSIEELDGDGNADCYWLLSAAESCQTCVERSQQWAPLKIRSGVVQ